MAVEHSGDCFHEYLLLDHSEVISDGAKRLRLEPVLHLLGAYTLGEPMGCFSKDDLAKVVSGESIMIEIPDNMPKIPIDPRIEDMSRHLREQAMLEDPGFANPNHETRIHDWRTHVGESVAKMWSKIPLGVRMAIVVDAEQQAGFEEYE